MTYLFLHIISILLFLGNTSNELTNSPSEPIVIIVNESIEIDQIDINELIDIYTLSKQRWDDNTRIRVADYKGSQDIRDTFYNALHTTPNNIKKIWLRAQFTGRSIPPIVVDSVDEMWKVVLENPGTIGYVPFNQVPVNAKILLQIDG